mmetsp:Transcript_3394/g.4741  ORF Transcript_3394/g.4741 Transcript_3394/m.4741 type:complete len:300 (+) Transcript_3394:119-1018(+)
MRCVTVVMKEAPATGRWLRQIQLVVNNENGLSGVAVEIARKLNVEARCVQILESDDGANIPDLITARILPPVDHSVASRLVVSDGSDDYPISEYSDDDESLNQKPLVARHKRTSIPAWARPDKTVELLQDLQRQSVMDAKSIFAGVDKVDLRDLFGYSPPPSVVRASKKRKRSHFCNDYDDLPANDVEIHLIAAHNLTVGEEVVVERGRKYVAVMRRDDKFSNLRRHYAKHNYLRDNDIVLCDINGNSLPLSAAPKNRPLHLFSNPTATVIVKLKSLYKSERKEASSSRSSVDVSLKCC